ncbi:hypothetical protein RHMOL_Rhmol13G0213100 [Rhododendron molle]|uniref:Uncharacterized protein n=1 Tax=Rhododendron molle TaxID=49168 RepID=A0ACC0L940_RHOML|nr:hypothetical protein RHMOL_Rhmol13G0213100 [Rhododendron molle]
MLLFDMRVDFVELRSEHYIESSSRSPVPGVKYEVDPSLRDFTINNLFYNVNTTSVEDFTGKDEELRAAIDSDVKAAINLVFWRETIICQGQSTC